MKIKVSDYVALFLRTQNIEHVFEVAGGMITHLLDAIANLKSDSATRIISVHHEQAAAFAADTYGRITGRPGVALATSGPGATNLLTGIASCYFDSSPALFITGQVNTHEQKGSRPIRQLGFQETDIVAMAEPITKKCFRIDSSDQIESTLIEAYTCAISGRPGPVLIDLPMNIQREEITLSPISIIEKKVSASATLFLELSVLKAQIKTASRPVLLLGGGIRCSKSEQAVLDFIDMTQIPVVTSLLALDAIPFEHPLRIGFIGTYGNRWANLALARADLLIVIGSRLDVRQTGADVAGFALNKTIVHIDCDESEINNRVKNCIPIVIDAKEFLAQANITWAKHTFSPYSTWLEEIADLKKAWPDVRELATFSGINPNELMHALSHVSMDAAGYVADVGNHQLWAAQSLELRANQVFLTSGGMGAMGFALPGAIGASLAFGKKPMVVIVGDGAFQMNIQELQTVVRNRIPLKIIVLNNNCLGMIRQFQDSYFESRYQSTYWGYSAPNFEAIATAYGIEAKTITNTIEIKDAMQSLWNNSDAPFVLQVMINPHMNVYPKIAFGKPISEMEPFSLPIGIEST